MNKLNRFGFSMLAAGLLCGCDEPDVLAVVVNPGEINPGESFNIDVVVGGDASKIDRIELTGLPSNTTGGGSPIRLNPVASGSSHSNTDILVSKPARDDVYRLTVTAYYQGGSSSATDVLTIKDVPALLSDVSIRPDSHAASSNCRGATNGFYARQFQYRVEDDNGANDVTNPAIVEATPLDSGNSITHVRGPLAPPTAASQVAQTLDTTIDIRCDMAVQPYTLKMEINEEDKPAGTGSRPTLTETVTYTVNP